MNLTEAQKLILNNFLNTVDIDMKMKKLREIINKILNRTEENQNPLILKDLQELSNSKSNNEESAYANWLMVFCYQEGILEKKDNEQKRELLKAYNISKEYLLKLFDLYAYLISQGKMDILDYLLERKFFNIDTKNPETGYALLHYCACYGSIQTFEQLLNKHKADVKVKDKLGRSVFILALGAKKLEMIKHIIIQKYCDINEIFEGNRTPIGYSFFISSPALAKFLFSWGACIDDVNASPKPQPLMEIVGHIRALHTHIRTKHSALPEELMSSLLSNRYAFNATTGKAKNTALHLCLLKEEPNIELIYQLLKYSNIELANANLQTGLSLLLGHKNLFLKFMGYYTKASMLYKTQDHAGEQNKKAKEENEMNFLKIREEFQKNIKTAEELLTQFNEEDPWKNVAHFLLGKLFGNSESPLDSEKAKEHLRQVKKTHEFFASANEIIYRLLLSEKPVDEETIKHLLYSGLKDEPIGKLLSGYVYGDAQSVKGLPNFDGFYDPDSCLVFVEQTKQDQMELLKTKNEKEALSKQLEESKKKNEAYETEIVKLRKELLERMSKTDSQLNLNASSESSSTSSSSSSSSSAAFSNPNKKVRLDPDALSDTPMKNNEAESATRPQNETGEPSDEVTTNRKRKMMS